MCEACGCAAKTAAEHRHSAHGHRSAPHATPALTIDVVAHLLRENDREAEHNREHFRRHHVLSVNLMSSPGAGKTSLLEATIDALGGALRLAVIEGDLATENDARRIRAKGVPAVQITTGQACHLDAHMVHDALHELDLAATDILFIENVGNLVCPASFDLGQHANVALLSVTEGDDKPAKYPVMFRAADLVLLSKTDLLGVIDDFDPDAAERHLRSLANPAALIKVSSRRPDSLGPWLAWLGKMREAARRNGARPDG
jgi:hydrogenase nickel incorporation protein HypB